MLARPTPCLFLAIIKERYEENFGYQYMCNSPAAPSPQSSISDPFSWAIIHSPRPILRLIRWCSFRRVLWWPEQPSSAKSFHLTHPMWLWYMRMTYSCSDAQGGSGNAKSSKKNAQSTRLGELHIWGTPPLTRSFIMAENRQGEWKDVFQIFGTSWMLFSSMVLKNEKKFIRYRVFLLTGPPRNLLSVGQ